MHYIEKKLPKEFVPPRPSVEYPVSWTWAVQQIVGQASWEAFSRLFKMKCGSPEGFSWISAQVELESRIFSGDEPELTREFWDLFVESIPLTVPRDGESRNGLTVDRAEATLYVWLRLFGES